MSRCLFYITCLVLLFCPGCCSRHLDSQTDTFGVTFVLDGGKEFTRATVSTNETSISDACMYFVNTDGIVIDAVSFNGNTVLRNFEAGTYRAYYVANCGLDERQFSTESGINAHVRSLSSEASLLSMFACKTFTVPDDRICSISVERLVSKVVIDKISIDFSRYPDLAAQSFTIDSIYLINVAGESVLADGTTFIPASSAWINKQRYSTSACDALLCDVVRQPVTATKPHSVPHYFYCYQNNVSTDSHTKGWNGRYTRLVIACTLGTVKTYYPIDITGPGNRLSRNCKYVINELIITDMGSDGPDNIVTGHLPYNCNYALKNWEGTYTISERF